MTPLSGFVRASVSIALSWVIGAPASAAQAGPVADVAIEIIQPGWKVLHCGVSRGVLYVTYVDQGQAAIAPAFATSAIRRACSQ